MVDKLYPVVVAHPVVSMGVLWLLVLAFNLWGVQVLQSGFDYLVCEFLGFLAGIEALYD